ncbi:MAG TPA: cobalt-precorrin-5B (C(1))-methyltransferase CbiD, partial [Victivallales bacterium]|nr:cobalt-precorrin-5B (C(1))-methyltransferase CbiD [Victivallales bacterium]
MKTQASKLKTGFTTGACATAAVKAAWLTFNNIKSPKKISIIFPDKKRRILELKSIVKRKYYSIASIIKNAGDDPDITNKIQISAKIKEISNSEISPHDHIIKIKNAKFAIRGGKGIGLVTRKGLNTPYNKSAINPGPLKMIEENIKNSRIKPNTTFLVEISAKNGEKIAQRTLNPVIGIIGGISIIGTTGIVVPFSNKAYINTIKILINSAYIKNSNHIVLATGNNSSILIKNIYPKLEDASIIRIADFIYHSIKFTIKYHFKKVTIACMPGKLLKYARGLKNTHAQFNPQDLSLVIKILSQLSRNTQIIKKIKNSKTINEALYYLPQN